MNYNFYQIDMRFNPLVTTSTIVMARNKKEAKELFERDFDVSYYVINKLNDKPLKIGV